MVTLVIVCDSNSVLWLRIIIQITLSTSVRGEQYCARPKSIRSRYEYYNSLSFFQKCHLKIDKIVTSHGEIQPGFVKWVLYHTFSFTCNFFVFGFWFFYALLSHIMKMILSNHEKRLSKHFFSTFVCKTIHLSPFKWTRL